MNRKHAALIAVTHGSARAMSRGTSLIVVASCACALAACASRGPITPTASARPQVRPDTAVQRAVQTERAIDGTVQANAVAVPPFRIARNDTTLEPLAYALADMLTSDLSLSRQLTLVERARLGDVLRELQLADAGRVDPTTAPRVGRMISARRLVLGAIDTVPGSSDVRVGVRLANVQSGLVERAIDARAPLNDILSAEKTLAFRIFDELGIVLSPAERAAISQRPTANLQAILAFGRGVRFQLLGDYAAAAREFRRAQQLDPNFREAGTRATATTTLANTPTTSPTPVSPATVTTERPPVTPPANPPVTPPAGPPTNPPGAQTTSPPAGQPPATVPPPRPTTTVTSTTTTSTPPATSTSTQTSPPPTLTVPGVHQVGIGVSSIIDRINRPLDIITTVTRASGTPADPSFPSTAATVILTVIRP